jgi:hypothetical protein
MLCEEPVKVPQPIQPEHVALAVLSSLIEPEKYPGLQLVHVVAPDVDPVPDEQVLHVEAPCSSEYFPRPQKEHNVAPLYAEKDPGGHCRAECRLVIDWLQQQVIIAMIWKYQ